MATLDGIEVTLNLNVNSFKIRKYDFFTTWFVFHRWNEIILNFMRIIK